MCMCYPLIVNRQSVYIAIICACIAFERVTILLVTKRLDVLPATYRLMVDHTFTCGVPITTTFNFIVTMTVTD